MKKSTINRLEKLERIVKSEENGIEILLEMMGIGEDGTPCTTGGIRIRSGKANEWLPDTFFSKEGENEKT